jgi:copper chaperone
MTCSGCSGAVTRALGKRKDDLGSESGTVLRQETTHFESVTNFDVNLEKEEAVVTATASYDEVYEVIKKTGKEVSTQNSLKILLW